MQNRSMIQNGELRSKNGGQNSKYEKTCHEQDTDISKQ